MHYTRWHCQQEKSVVEIYAVHRDEGWENAGEQAVSGSYFLG